MLKLILILSLLPTVCLAANFDDLKEYYPMNVGDTWIYDMAGNGTPALVTKIIECRPEQGCASESIVLNEIKTYSICKYMGNIVVNTVGTNGLTGELQKSNKILLKSPLVVGTSWKDVENEESYKIINIINNFKTISGSYDKVIVIERKIKHKNRKDKTYSIEYYAPKVGRVMSVFVGSNGKKSKLSELIQYIPGNQGEASPEIQSNASPYLKH